MVKYIYIYKLDIQKRKALVNSEVRILNFYQYNYMAKHILGICYLFPTSWGLGRAFTVCLSIYYKFMESEFGTDQSTINQVI